MTQHERKRFGRSRGPPSCIAPDSIIFREGIVMSGPKKFYLTIAGFVSFVIVLYLVARGSQFVVEWAPTVNWVPVLVMLIACLMLCFAVDTTYTYFFTDAARPVETVCLKWLGYCTKAFTNTRTVMKMAYTLLAVLVSIFFVCGVAVQVRDLADMSRKARSFDQAVESLKETVSAAYEADLQKATERIVTMSKDIAEKDALIADQKATIEQLREDNKALQRAAKTTLSQGARGNP